MYTHKHILTNSWAHARGSGCNKLPTRSRFVCLPECPFVSHTHIIGHDPLSYPKSQWLKMHSRRLIQERKISYKQYTTSRIPVFRRRPTAQQAHARTHASMHACTRNTQTYSHATHKHTSTHAKHTARHRRHPLETNLLQSSKAAEGRS